MRKRILALLLAAATALGLCACAPEGDRTDSGKLSVVCSLFPYYDFVRVIGGEWVEPRLLVAAGREAHSFEPTPADVIRVSRADVFVYNGGEGGAMGGRDPKLRRRKHPHGAADDGLRPDSGGGAGGR